MPNLQLNTLVGLSGFTFTIKRQGQSDLSHSFLTLISSVDNQNNLVSRLATRRRLAIGEDWSQDVHFGEQSELRYSYHVFCEQFYFGDGCAEYCRPRNDTLGHYACDAEGNRICLEGWKGNYCSERKTYVLLLLIMIIIIYPSIFCLLPLSPDDNNNNKRYTRQDINILNASEIITTADMNTDPFLNTFRLNCIK